MRPRLYLIGRSEERTRPPGIDGTLLAWPFLALEQWVPRRLRPMPPFFLALALVGLLWGICFPICRVVGICGPGGLHPAAESPLFGTSLDVVAFVMAAAGLVEAWGHWTRRPWGVAATYLWLTIAGIYGLFAEAAAAMAAETSAAGAVVSALLLLAVCAALMVYYDNRKRWFGV